MGKLRKFLANPFAVVPYLGHRGLLNWLPDAAYLKLLYRARLGERLDLEDPRGFNAKLQWLKLHDRDPRYTVLVDKHLVKEVVRDALGEGAVVPTLGVWDDAAHIDFDRLPDQFVLKANHNSGGVIICRDKSSFDTGVAAAALNAQLERAYFWPTREWPYKDVRRVVFAEEYLPDLQEGGTGADGVTDGSSPAPAMRGVVDYKFYCFHGEPRFLYVSQGLEDHATARIAFLDLDWNRLEFGRADYENFDVVPAKPACFAEMVDAARTLSAGIPFVRVDLFEQRGTVLFSEMTFHPVAGMMPFVPKEADLEIGRLLDLGRVRRPT